MCVCVCVKLAPRVKHWCSSQHQLLCENVQNSSARLRGRSLPRVDSSSVERNAPLSAHERAAVVETKPCEATLLSVKQVRGNWAPTRRKRGASHLGVLSPASGWLQGVCSLDDLLGRGGGFVRGVVGTLLHHVLALLALWCGRARAFTQDWWAGGRALVWVTGSAEREETERGMRTK